MIINKIFTFLSFLLASILVTGCGPTYVGVRAGADIPLHKARTSYSLNDESRHVGLIVGGVVDQSISKFFGLLFEPGVSTRIKDQYNVTAEGIYPERTNMTITHEYSYVHLPLLLRFSLPIEGSSFKPYISAGLRYLIGYSETVRSESISYMNNIPYLKLSRNNPQINSLYSLDPTFGLGTDIQTSKSLTLRIDSRLQHSFYDLEQYSIIGSTISDEKNTVIPIVSSMTHLSFSVSMIVRL